MFHEEGLPREAGEEAYAKNREIDRDGNEAGPLGQPFPILSGQDRLAEDLAVERMSVHRYLKELKDKGAIRIARRGAMKTNIYTIVKLSDVSFLRHHDVTPMEHQEDPGIEDPKKKMQDFEFSTFRPTHPLFCVQRGCREPRRCTLSAERSLSPCVAFLDVPIVDYHFSYSVLRLILVAHVPFAPRLHALRYSF